MRFVAVITGLIFPLFSFAQADTIVTWLDATERATSKDAAVYVRRQYRFGDGCKVQDFHLATGNLTYEGVYDASCKKRNGIFTWYADSGTLNARSIYENDKRKEHHLFYSNGVKRMEAFFKDDKPFNVRGWDSNGNEIPNSIYEQEASFPGGTKAWHRYLSRAITSDLPDIYKRGFISGVAVVDFAIDVNGGVIDARVSQSSGFPELDDHALNIMKKSARWNPAIQYNEKVIFRQRQSFTYPVYEQ